MLSDIAETHFFDITKLSLKDKDCESVGLRLYLIENLLGN
jgi:hypothetical protein